MGTTCRYCTMWADGFIGVLPHTENRAAFVVVSNDNSELQKKFHKSRNWNFKMVSAAENTFTKDMRMGTARKPMPSVSTFYEENKKSSELEKTNSGQEINTALRGTSLIY